MLYGTQANLPQEKKNASEKEQRQERDIQELKLHIIDF